MHVAEFVIYGKSAQAEFIDPLLHTPLSFGMITNGGARVVR